MSVKKYALPLILDVVLVIVFCAIGRQTHDEENAIAGLATTAWPFLSGLLIGWAATYALYRDKFDAYLVIPTGVIVWLSTVILGMALRIGVSGTNSRSGLSWSRLSHSRCSFSVGAHSLRW